jgi:nitrite reductase (NADH) small subunit
MARFVEVRGIDEIQEGRAVAVDVEGLRIAVYRDGETFHALLARCPHAGGDMAAGWVEDGEAVCPLHRWRFRLASGRCSTIPGQSLHRFRTEVRDGRVWVEA